MVINCAFIEAGKAPPVTICRMYLNCARIAGMSRIFFVAMRSRKNRLPIYSHIHFTSDLDEVLNDPMLSWLLSAPTRTAISRMYRNALEAGKNVLVENRSPDACQGEGAVCVGEKQRADRHVRQNRRFDSAS